MTVVAGWPSAAMTRRRSRVALGVIVGVVVLLVVPMLVVDGPIDPCFDVSDCRVDVAPWRSALQVAYMWTFILAMLVAVLAVVIVPPAYAWHLYCNGLPRWLRRRESSVSQ